MGQRFGNFYVLKEILCLHFLLFFFFFIIQNTCNIKMSLKDFYEDQRMLQRETFPYRNYEFIYDETKNKLIEYKTDQEEDDFFVDFWRDDPRDFLNEKEVSGTPPVFKKEKIKWFIKQIFSSEGIKDNIVHDFCQWIKENATTFFKLNEENKKLMLFVDITCIKANHIDLFRHILQYSNGRTKISVRRF